MNSSRYIALLEGKEYGTDFTLQAVVFK